MEREGLYTELISPGSHVYDAKTTRRILNVCNLEAKDSVKNRKEWKRNALYSMQCRKKFSCKVKGTK